MNAGYEVGKWYKTIIRGEAWYMKFLKIKNDLIEASMYIYKNELYTRNTLFGYHNFELLHNLDEIRNCLPEEELSLYTQNNIYECWI